MDHQVRKQTGACLLSCFRCTHIQVNLVCALGCQDGTARSHRHYDNPRIVVLVVGVAVAAVLFYHMHPFLQSTRASGEVLVAALGRLETLLWCFNRVVIGVVIGALKGRAERARRLFPKLT